MSISWRNEYRLLPDGNGWVLMSGRRVIARGSAATIGAVLAQIERGEIARAS